jgi:hypothetical protein
MSTTPPKMSEAAIRKLDEARSRLSCFIGRLWRKVLTEDERRRLGGSQAMALGVVGIWQKLHGCSEPRAVIEASIAVEMLSPLERKWLLKEIGEPEDDVDAATQTAVDTGNLVLIERPRQAYWKRQPIEIDWARKSTLWGYFWELASHSKRGGALDQTFFRNEPGDPNVLIKWKNRLITLKGFPSSLRAKIVKAGTGTQKLDLAPAEIQLFEIVTTETLRPASR